MLDKKDLVAVREGAEGDRNFILATWLRGLYFGNPWFNLIPMPVFMENYHAFLERLLALPTLRIRVACLKDDPDVILGYSVSHGQSLDWIFVKAAWRKIGIGRSLVPDDTASVSHLTKVGQSLLKKRPAVVFNPFA